MKCWMTQYDKNEINIIYLVRKAKILEWEIALLSNENSALTSQRSGLLKIPSNFYDFQLKSGINVSRRGVQFNISKLY